MSESSHTNVILAGAAAAFTVDLLIYPLDTLKTRQQSRDFVTTFATDNTSSLSTTKAATTAARQHKPPKQLGLFRGLYQGVGIVILATLPAAGTFFTTYEASKTFFARNFSSPSGGKKGGNSITLPQPIIHSSASALAECASCLVLTPAEVVKQNAQMIRKNASKSNPSSSISTSSTSLQALRQLGGADSGRRLLSGYTALVARNLPFTALQFPIFEHLREKIWDHRRRASPSSSSNREKRSLLETGVITGVSAGLAGSFSALMTTPMDVVKTRMMLYSPEGKKEKGNRSSMMVARQVLAEKGIPGLFRGGLLRSVWTAVGSGLYLGTYEAARVWLTDER